MLVTLGRKIYYHKITGEIIYNTGERAGYNITDTTTEEDFQFALELKHINPDIVGVLRLDVGEYNEEFTDFKSFRVNPETEKIEFGNQIGNVISFQKPYKEQLQDLEERTKATEDAILALMGGM